MGPPVPTQLRAHEQCHRGTPAWVHVLPSDPCGAQNCGGFGWIWGVLSKSPIQIPEVIRSFEQLQYMSVYVSIETRGLGTPPCRCIV
jgi:hypothetical protein